MPGRYRSVPTITGSCPHPLFVRRAEAQDAALPGSATWWPDPRTPGNKYGPAEQCCPALRLLHVGRTSVCEHPGPMASNSDSSAASRVGTDPDQSDRHVTHQARSAGTQVECAATTCHTP